MKKFLSLALCLIMVLSMVACADSPEGPAQTSGTPSQSKAPEQTTGAPEQTTEAPEQTTEAPEQTTEAPKDETTAAPAAPSVEFKDLPAAEQAALLALMPATLPDGSAYELACRAMCFDNGETDYYIEGNSAGSAKFVDVTEGAIYGKAIKMAAKADEKDNRAEIQVLPYGDVKAEGARGIMFYVDFSNVLPHSDATKKMCASVTMNTNDYRAKGPNGGNGDSSAIAYYYLAGSWVQTTNINACRQEIPENFAGWVYIPASTYYDGVNKTGIGETFGDIFVTNMRFYTDGYTYSADNYIIFDEIVFVK